MKTLNYIRSILAVSVALFVASAASVNAALHIVSNSTAVAVSAQMTEGCVTSIDPQNDVRIAPGGSASFSPYSVSYNWVIWINGCKLRGSTWGPLQSSFTNTLTAQLDNKQTITIKRWSDNSSTSATVTNNCDYIDFETIWVDGVIEIVNILPTTADLTRFSPDALALGGNTMSCPKGMAGYSFNALHASLRVQDTPLGYAPPIGPSVAFSFIYNQRDTTRDTNVNFSNLGPRWTLANLSYIEDNPASLTNIVRCYVQGGGSEDYTGFTASVTNSTRHPASQCVLSRAATNAYVRVFPDGSRDVYSWSITLANGTRRIFLTQQLDTSNNALSYGYDTPTNSTARLTQITDAIGQSSTIAYQYAGDALKITSISDPFARTVTIGYVATNGATRLASLSDPVGIVSSFTYSNDCINSLTTPYGTTTFATWEDINSRVIEATDPLGATEHMEFRSYDTVPAISIPTNMIGDAGLRNINNTIYWDARAWSRGSNDVSKAQIIHWASPSDQVSGVPLWIKRPLEQAVSFNFAGQTNSFGGGLTSESPTMAGRILDGGIAQTNSFQYDTFGNLTNAVDPIGRTARFIYSTNGIDLLEVDQKNGASWDVLGTFTYNAQHLPLVTIAAGVTNRYGFSTNGLLLKSTNGLGHVTTFNYDQSGYLTNVTGHLPTDTLNISYDSTGRIRTLTDSDGFTVTNSYDDLDRLTQIAFPDGTSRQYVYNRLDMGKTKGRDNRWTYFTHEAPGRLTDVQDTLGRITHFARCACGDLEGITDPKGNYTTWLKDDAGRTQTKLYPDRTATQFAYATNASQLKKLTLAKGNTSTLVYNADGSLHTSSNSVGNLSDPIEYDYSSTYPRLWILSRGGKGWAFGYVPSGQPGAGSLASITGDPYFSIFYTNDVIGRIQSGQAGSTYFKVQYDELSRVYWSSNNQGATTATYDGASERVKTVRRPNGITTVFGYTSITNGSQLQFVWHTNQAGTTLARYDYTRDVLGRITQMTNTVGGATTNWAYQYDAAGQLLSATATTTNGTVARRYRYNYDASGNRISQQIDSAATIERVNGLNQLTNRAATGGIVRVAGHISETGLVTVAGVPARMTTATNFESEVYAPSITNVVSIAAADPNGNVATTNRVFTVASNGAFGSLTYDLNGNLLKKDTRLDNAWDEFDRCYYIGYGTTNTRVGYDPLGRWTCLAECTGDTTNSVRYFKWEGLRLAEEQNASGTVIRRYFPGGFWFNNTNFFYLADHLGSVRQVTTTNGTVVARFEYDPWGKRTQTFGTTSFVVDIGFTGHFHHGPSGLIFAPLRIYDPETGRWISRDPIQEKGGLNLYEYCGGDPVNCTDATGRAPNRAGATTSDHVRDFLQNTPDLRLLSSNHVSNVNRYFYTQKFGWVDIRHFGEAAYRVEHGQFGWDVRLMGFLLEAKQWAFEWGNAYRSGFSPEDCPSNAAGVSFAQFRQPTDTLDQAFAKWAKSVGALSLDDPRAHYWLLPAEDPAWRGNNGGSHFNSTKPSE